jgi:hypothetical protein
MIVFETLWVVEGGEFLSRRGLWSATMNIDQSNDVWLFTTHQKWSRSDKRPITMGPPLLDSRMMGHDLATLDDVALRRGLGSFGMTLANHQCESVS